MNPDDHLEDDCAFEDELITPIDQRSESNDDPDNLEETDDEDDLVGMLSIAASFSEVEQHC